MIDSYQPGYMGYLLIQIQFWINNAITNDVYFQNNIMMLRHEILRDVWMSPIKWYLQSDRCWYCKASMSNQKDGHMHSEYLQHFNQTTFIIYCLFRVFKKRISSRRGTWSLIFWNNIILNSGLGRGCVILHIISITRNINMFPKTRTSLVGYNN